MDASLAVLSRGWLVVSLLLYGITSPEISRGEDAAAEAVPAITVEFWIAELSVKEMRGFGMNLRDGRSMDFEEVFASAESARAAFQQTFNQDAKNWAFMFKYLEARKVAHLVAQPKLTAINGHLGNLTADDISLQAKPTMRDDGRIGIQYKLEVGMPPPKSDKPDTRRPAPMYARMLKSSAALPVEPGKPTIADISRMGTTNGKPPETMVLVLVLADVVQAGAEQAQAGAAPDE